ncbi:MAG: prepilin peptidase [Planctomycetota bacterium]
MLLGSAVAFGAVVGSFLNVVIYRLPHGTFWSGGMRSVCANASCRRPVPWYHNIPVLAWLWLRGKTHCCGVRLSVRYPLVEALTALLFGLLWLYPPAGPVLLGQRPDGSPEIDGPALLALVFHAVFIANLIANTFIDIDHRILPDVLTKSALALGLLAALLVPGFAGFIDVRGLSPAASSLLYSGLGAACGYGLTQGIRLLAQGAFRREAMGYGDVKLMAAIGAYVGWDGVMLTFFLGSVLGAFVGVVHRWLTKDAYIFFGPFLAAGALITLLARDSLEDGFASFQEWQRTNASSPWVAGVTAALSGVLLVVLVRRGRAR